LPVRPRSAALFQFKLLAYVTVAPVVNHVVVDRPLGSGAEIAKFVSQLQPAFAHQTRCDGGVEVGFDIPVPGEVQLESAVVGTGESRVQKTRLSLIGQWPAQPREIEKWYTPNFESNVARGAGVGGIVDLNR